MRGPAMTSNGWIIAAGSAAALLLAACSRTDNEPGPGGVTVSEAKALDEAAEMLESRQSARADDPAEPDADGAGAPE